MAGQTASTRLVKLWWRAAPSAVAALALIGGTAEDCAAQSGRKWFNSKPTPVKQAAPPQNGFAATIERLLNDARRQAAAGQIEESIKTAQRARKIAEASSAVLRDDPAVTVAAADELLRELYTLQGELPSLNPVAAAPPMPQPTVPVSMPSRTTTAYHEAIAEHRVALPNPPVQSSSARPVPVEVRPHSAAVSQVVPHTKAIAPSPAEAPRLEQARSAPLLAAARTYPTPAPVRSEILASSRASSGSYVGSGGFTILGGNVAPTAEPAVEPEPVEEPMPTIEVVLGQPVPLLPTAVAVMEDTRDPEAVVSAPVVVREFRPEPLLAEVLPPVATVDSVPPIQVVLGQARSLPTAPIAPAAPDPVDIAEALDSIKSIGDSSATLSANRPVMVTVSEPDEELLTPAAPVIAESATPSQPTSIPVGSEPVLGSGDEEITAWTSTEPTRRRPIRSQTAELDTAWESANSRKAEPDSAPTTGPSASVPTVTPNAIATPVILSPIITEPDAEQVTQIGFAPASQAVAEVSATVPAAPSVAPPPPREIEDAPASTTPALSFDDADDIQGPAAWVREQTVSAPAPQPQWSASLVDQLAKQWKQPAQTIAAGLAAAGLALLGLGLTLVRFATRRGH